MPETNQSRWMGIRGVVPAENIPVDIKSATVWLPVRIDPIANSVTVAPEAAGTIFKTATEKRAPAIADMQAVESMMQDYVGEAKGATPHIVDLYTVPAGKILMLTMLYATYSAATVTTIDVSARIDLPPVTGFPLAYWAHTANWETHTWFGSLPVNEGTVIRFTWTGGAAGGNVIGAMMGYIINKYA